MNIAGYMICRRRKQGFNQFEWEGQSGLAFDYVLAGNGLFISATNRFLSVMIPIAPSAVRGLPLLETIIHLKHGKVPQRLLDLALSVMLARPEIERYIGIAWTGTSYQLVLPEQDADAVHVSYSVPEDIVIEFHTHCGRRPAFSPVDNADEQGMKIYGVIGDLHDGIPSVNFRLGVYGYFHSLRWGDIFEGKLDGVNDVVELMNEDKDSDEL